MGLKALAYHWTGSIGLLSDALESLVNLAGALMALAMLTAAALPPDEDHAYGHSKAEYFSSVLEGTLILDRGRHHRLRRRRPPAPSAAAPEDRRRAGRVGCRVRNQPR